jgi:glutathione peroxidase
LNSIHRFKVEGIAGEEIDFAKFKGKKILVVNVASECGYTPQYAQLQELYEAYSHKLVIVGFPSNDFGAQEPGSNASVAKFCQLRYGVSFPLTVKVHIKAPNVHPVYQWLTQQSENGVMDSEVKWNFQKYLLDEAGQLIDTFLPSCSPLDEHILSHIVDE